MQHWSRTRPFPILLPCQNIPLRMAGPPSTGAEPDPFLSSCTVKTFLLYSRIAQHWSRTQPFPILLPCQNIPLVWQDHPALELNQTLSYPPALSKHFSFMAGSPSSHGTISKPSQFYKKLATVTLL